MFEIGAQVFDESFNPSGASGEEYQYYFDWRVDIFHQSGGYKKSMFFGMENNPIQSIDYELNKHYMGAGDIDLAFVDFSIDINDIVKIYFQNELDYTGLVDTLPDAKKGKLKLVPYSQQFQERIIDASYSSETASNILQDIITTYTSDIGINWDAAQVDTGELTKYTMTFKNSTMKKAIDDIIKLLDDREWAVTANNTFTVYQPNSTVDEILYQAEDKYFTEVKRKINNSKIKATRYYDVTGKTATGEQTGYGQVGYDLAGGTYPTLAIEKIARRKDSIFSISQDNVSSTTALNWAYADLETNAVQNQTIQVKGVRIDKYNGSIGEYIKVIDDYERALITIEDCDSTDGWTNTTNYTDDFVEGTGCQQMIGSDSVNSAIYKDFGEVKRYWNIEHLEFMVFSDEDNGNTLQVGLSNDSSTLWNNPYEIYIDSIVVWERKQIAITETEFRYIGFRMKGKREVIRNWHVVGVSVFGESAYPSLYTINRFDRLRLYTWTRNEYEGNIVKIKKKIDRKGVDVQLTLNDYDLQANDDLFAIENEVRILKEVQTN